MAIATETLSKIKLSLRIVDDAFDVEIEDLAEAALIDLHIAGVRGDGVDL